MKKVILTGLAILVIGSVSLFAASQDLTAEGNKNLRSANLHLREGRPEKALPFYELVLEDNSHNIEALNKMAGIYYDFNFDYKKAIAIYTNVLVEIDEVYAEYNTLMQTDEKAAKKFHKKYIKNIKLDDINERIPKLMQICWVKLFLDAQTDTQNDSLQSALDKFLYVLEIAPDSVKTLKMIAFVYSKMGDEVQSLNYMEKVAEKDTLDDIVRTQIGNTNFENGNYEAALKWYKAAAQINPESVDNYFNMALAYNKLKDQENTLISYEKVLKFEPDNLDALIFASEIYEKLGNKEQSLAYLETALQQYKKILESDPDNIDVLAYSSNIYEKLGNMDESIKCLKKAVDLDPQNINWISYLTYTLTREKRYAEALVYAKKWLELVPNSEEAVNYINLTNQMIKK
ncbi:MAG: tetratricopeptide repeat protein [Candidatus Cloacimonadales bacterium]|nr:tetratricopeptide repeat protein [Candidatus Cloacimonadales bacterium]